MLFYFSMYVFSITFKTSFSTCCLYSFSSYSVCSSLNTFFGIFNIYSVNSSFVNIRRCACCYVSPELFAMLIAVSVLSPVSIQTRIPASMSISSVSLRLSCSSSSIAVMPEYFKLDSIFRQWFLYSSDSSSS